MKVDFFKRQTMHGGLGLGQSPKNPQGEEPLPFGQTGSANDLFDFRQEAVALFFMDYDVHRSGGKAAFADRFDFHADLQIQGGERLLNRAGVDASVDQSAQRHIAADASEAVKMSPFHGESLLLV